MTPEKAKKAIIIVLITALIIISVCLCLLFDYNPFSKKDAAEEQPAASTEPAETAAAASPSPPPSPAPVPSSKDLKGCSDDLYYPKAENYLPEYQSMITHASNGEKIYLQYKPEPWQYYRETIIELENNTPVTAIAKENGYTLVLVKEGVGGWVLTHQLENS